MTQPNIPAGGKADVSDRYLTTDEVAARYRTSASTVRFWRSRSVAYGPKGVKVGRRILYSIAECERFEAELARAASGAA